MKSLISSTIALSFFFEKFQELSLTLLMINVFFSKKIFASNKSGQFNTSSFHRMDVLEYSGIFKIFV